MSDIRSTCEVAIVGAGPAGLAAACVLAGKGVDAVVLDEQQTPGGQVFRGIEKVNAMRPSDLNPLGASYGAGTELARRFRDSGAHYRPGTSVWEVTSAQEPELALGLVENGNAQMLYPRHIILATGAMERPTPFLGWTLPGVMTIGAAQTLLKSSGLLPEKDVVLAGTGPLLYLYANQLIGMGMRPQAILDTRPSVSWGTYLSGLNALLACPGAMIQGIRWMHGVKRQVEVASHVTDLRAKGDDRLRSVSYRSGGCSYDVATALLLVHDGVIPNTWLSMSAGIAHRFDSLQGCWVPDIRGVGLTSRDSISMVGDVVGIAGAEVAMLQGERAADEVLGQLNGIGSAQPLSEPAVLSRQRRLRRFLDRYFPPTSQFQLPPDDDTIVCRCEEVTAGEIRSVAARGCMGPNQAKAFTRCGMGPCMGRKCAATVSQLMAQVHDMSVRDIGHYRIRPPIRPITVGQLADMPIQRESSDAAQAGATIYDTLAPGKNPNR
jgi:NADPH-dependent 2,4-dienoyl-CoA reductase/sulfur reductase-like enzyme